MKQIKRVGFILIIAILLLIGCSDYTTNVEAKKSDDKNHPFEIYTHIDNDGCEYIIVYEEKGFNGSYAGGVGLGIAAKVNQPEQCKSKTSQDFNQSSQ